MLKRSLYWMTAVVLGALVVTSAHAVPSMGRQTGYECSKCHTVFPMLTPFGREFKLGGFSMTSKKFDELPLLDRIPVSGLLQVSYSKTRNTTTQEPTDEFMRNREVIVQAVGAYLGGRIVDNAGALIQYNWDGIERKWGMEMFDARYANEIGLGGKELVLGVTTNNNPTLSDIHNSTPVWAFPHTDSATVMPAASTLIDMTLASQVGGIGGYGMWGDLLYGEVAVYHTAKKGFWRFMGLGVPTETVVDGNAPYWRFALQHEAEPHSFHIGTYGMNGAVLSDPEDASIGSDRFRDFGLDAGYEYLQGDHSLSTHATWIYEKQYWNSSYPQGLSSSPSTVLKTFRADVHYFYRRQLGGILQYFNTNGDANDLHYNTGEPVTGSANGSPNSRGWVAELNYLPIQNVKLAVRYTAYQQFNGASSNYDGFGRNAKDNNSVFLLAWLLL